MIAYSYYFKLFTYTSRNQHYLTLFHPSFRARIYWRRTYVGNYDPDEERKPLHFFNFTDNKLSLLKSVYRQ